MSGCNSGPASSRDAAGVGMENVATTSRTLTNHIGPDVFSPQQYADLNYMLTSRLHELTGSSFGSCLVIPQSYGYDFLIMMRVRDQAIEEELKNYFHELRRELIRSDDD